jgi:hypothetical protein
MMTLRPVTAFLVALTAIVVLLAAVAVVQTRLDQGPALELDGEWELAHRVQWGPYKSWTFDYRISLERTGEGITGNGETIAVNGDPPGPGQRTTLQVVNGMRERGKIIVWFFERNGDRAGRGAIKWRVADENRLVGTFATTFYRGASVARRIAEPAQPASAGRE